MRDGDWSSRRKRCPRWTAGRSDRKRPKPSPRWYPETIEFIEENREKLIADARWRLEQPPKTMSKVDRWSLRSEAPETVAALVPGDDRVHRGEPREADRRCAMATGAAAENDVQGGPLVAPIGSARNRRRAGTRRRSSSSRRTARS